MNYKTKKLLSYLLTVILLMGQSLPTWVSLASAASSPWNQTDWSGESGTNVDTTTAGQISLSNTEKLSNTGFETNLTGWETPVYSTNLQNTQASNLVSYYPLNESSGSVATAINPAVATGRNIVINGGFDADSDWTKGTGW